MEDMFLNRNVNNIHLFSVINEFLSIDGNFITLINEPNYDKKHGINFGIISPGAMYRATATAALWKIDILAVILRKNETAWDFEKKGSVRSDRYDGFYSVEDDCFSFFHGVIKGQWTIEAVKEFDRIGLSIDLTSRSIFSSKTVLFRFFYVNVRKILIKIVPFKYRRLMLRN
jgi:hypothetical protein